MRPGIVKLMQIRAKSRGKDKIDDQFLTEIRDESMMLVTRRMKKLGFDQIDMGAWQVAKNKFTKSPVKREVIDKITAMLNERDEKNEVIMDKFSSFFADNVGEKIGWTKEARARIEKAPAFAREFAKKSVSSPAYPDVSLSSISMWCE